MADTASNGTGDYASANYIALTADTSTPVDTDTTLPGEIETGDSGTLSRVQATYAHTSGTSTYTLTNLFTSDESVVVATSASSMTRLRARSCLRISSTTQRNSTAVTSFWSWKL